MCGIAGVYYFDAGTPTPDPELIRRMREPLAHRGPDDDGLHLGPGVGLGFRRLSIIDLDTGHQPMSNEDDSVWLVFNGEIYNFRELRRELEARGHQFRTRSDSEVILHLYEDSGKACVERLRGMFAFAIYDRREHRLLLARDRLGIKPLYYRVENERLLFGSEPKAILAVLPSEERRLDPSVAGLYFSLLYVPDAVCAFEGMQRLPPGHRLEIGPEHRQLPERYWQAPTPEIRHRGLDETARQVRELLEESVRLRMVADVPLGAFLSGGLDSAAVVGIMSALSPEPVKTFTIGFRDFAWNESDSARITARFHGTDHHELIAEPDSVELVQKLVGAFDEPFGDPSAIPTYLVSRLAREHVTVVMSGDGGDELFAGYKRYRRLRQIRRLRRIPALVRETAARALAPVSDRHNLPRTVHRTLRRSLQEFPDDYFSGETFLRPEMRRVVEPLLGDLEDDGDPGRGLYRRYARDADPLAAAQLIDLELYLPGDILTKLDRASMACSLEARVPLLDHHLVELAASIPTELKFEGDRGKKILRRACADLYPPEIVNLRKSGFGVPIQQWFRGPLREMIQDTLLGRTCRERGYYDAAALSEMIEQHALGRRDQSVMLYGLLMFELWAQSMES